MGKGLLIIIVGSMMTLAMVSMTFVKTAHSGIDNAMDFYEEVQARNIGNSMVNMLLSRIADSISYRVTDSESKSYLGGDLDYTVIDTALVAGDTLIRVRVNVEYNEYSKTITSYTNPSYAAGWVPPVVRGAWTANGDLNNTISDMYLDGRNYDLNLNIIPNTGTRAVSTSVEFTNVENAALGGTSVDSTDYALQYPENSNTVEEFYNWDGAFPETPDEILGYPEGTLKQLAQLGFDGSHYYLNPPYSGGKNVIDDLIFPFSGVTYIELTDGVERELVMEGFGHSGVLIVHGPNRSSRLRGLKIDDGIKAKKTKEGDPIVFCHLPGDPNQETLSTDNEDSLNVHIAHGDQLDDCPEVTDARFTGLIVTDYSFHHHLDILGAMLMLSPNLEESKNCNGNKEHWVRYSEEAIEQATAFTAKKTGLMGNAYNVAYNLIGFGPGRQKAFYWFE